MSKPITPRDVDMTKVAKGTAVVGRIPRHLFNPPPKTESKPVPPDFDFKAEVNSRVDKRLKKIREDATKELADLYKPDPLGDKIKRARRECRNRIIAKYSETDQANAAARLSIAETPAETKKAKAVVRAQMDWVDAHKAAYADHKKALRALDKSGGDVAGYDVRKGWPEP